MGRHGATARPPRQRGDVLRATARGTLRWLGRCALGASTAAVVLAATSWAGMAWTTARLLAVGTAVVTVAASALAATLPAPHRAEAPGAATGAGPADPRDTGAS